MNFVVSFLISHRYIPSFFTHEKQITKMPRFSPYDGYDKSSFLKKQALFGVLMGYFDAWNS